MKMLRFLVIAALVLAASQLAYSGAGKAADKARQGDNLHGQMALFADAVSVIRNEYVDEVDSKKLIYGAMRGMLGSLDDYSQFMDPEEYDEIRLETKGEFGGIGVEISLKDGILTIIAPMAGTPAEQAGIKAGDRIVKIDGEITRNTTLNDAVKRMRGKPGSVVKLTVWREGLPSMLDIAIRRDIIKVRSIKKAEMIGGGIGYIKLVEFQEKTPRDLDEAIRRLRAAGMDSLILDLRNNPGGLLDGAVDVAERFIAKDDVIVSIRSRHRDESATIKSSGRLANVDFPLVVMVNEGSASASEVVAGAVKDNKRGIVLGAKTFGKASVQTVIPLRDGSAVRLTTAYYVTPAGMLIKNEGIMPDVLVGESAVADEERAEAERIFEDLERLPASGKSAGHKNAEEPGGPAMAEPERDEQLDSAVSLMSAVKAGHEGVV